MTAGKVLKRRLDMIETVCEAVDKVNAMEKKVNVR